MSHLEDHPIAAIFPLLQDDELHELADSIQKNGQRQDIVLYQEKILDGRNRYRACEIAGVTPTIRYFEPDLDGKSVLQFVLDENLNRRHLTASQRAMITAQSVAFLQAEAKKANEGQPDTPAPAKPAGATTPPAKQKTFADGTLMEEDPPEAAAAPIAPLEALPDPEPEPSETEPPTDAQLAEAANVSERSISTAKSIIKNDPTGEKAADVASGKKTLNAAATEQKNEQHAEERKKIITRIRKVCGENFAQAVIDNELLKTAKEMKAFIALEDSDMLKVAGLVATGWKVGRAHAQITRKITGETTLDDLLNRTIAEKGIMTFEHNGFEVHIEKLGK